ncbi:MAG: hypothetical protein AAF899_09870 [Pseudomonadota bacterium]
MLLRRTARFLALPLALSVHFHSAGAQETPTATVQQQDSLFAQLLERPDDLNLMFAYARVSIELGDYEAAIATLERMLVFRQDLDGVRLELAVAYFALGSYEVSKLYFDQVRGSDQLDADDIARIDQYLAAIAARTQRSAFSAIANLGITFATNANLAPTDRTLVLGGVTGFELAEEDTEQSDFGVRALVTARHVYDLERPNNDAWVTDAGAFLLRYFQEERGDTFFLRARTGPRLSLGPGQDASTIRPYVEGQYLNGEDETIFFSGLGGAVFRMPLDAQTRVIADFNVGYFEFEQSRDEEDRVSVNGSVGAVHALSPDLTVNAAVVGGYDSADADFNTNGDIGLRGGFVYRYDSGVSFVDRKWSLSGYGEVRGRLYAEENPLIDPDETRREVDLRMGLSHLFAVREGFGVQADVEGFLRRSNIQNFDLDNVSVTVSLQYRL